MDGQPGMIGTSGLAVPAVVLPAWESFASADRQRLVQTLLQAAQQHLMTTPPTGSTTALGR